MGLSGWLLSVNIMPDMEASRAFVKSSRLSVVEVPENKNLPFWNVFNAYLVFYDDLPSNREYTAEKYSSKQSALGNVLNDFR